MAPTSIPAVPTPLLGQSVAVKLTKTNYALWKAQVLPILKGAQLQGYLDGSADAPEEKIKPSGESNPEYIRWAALEQQVLGFLMTSMTQEVMAQVSICETPQEVWSQLQKTYASQSRARTVNTRIALATTRKGNMTMSEYVAKMKSLADEMASAKKNIDEEELVSYILAGLDEEYNSVVSALVARVEPVTVAEAAAQLFSFESRMDLLHGGRQPNAAGRGRGGSPGYRGHGRCRGRGRGRGPPGGRSYQGTTPSNGRQQFRRSDKACQVCENKGHTALDCWYRFDESYSSNTKTAAAATHGYGVDTNWYMDTAATDHITSDLDKLTVQNKYKGTDQIITASGAGMNINNIGHAVINTPVGSLQLKNVLHVPHATKN